MTGAAAAYASSGRLAAWIAPEAENVRTEARGYQFSVHPAFSHHAELRDAAGRVTDLYTQKGVLNLRDGRTGGPEQHVIRLEGGQFGRDLSLAVRDPRHQVARITVELYGPDHQPGSHAPAVEMLVVENAPTVCPPVCGPHSGGGGGGGFNKLP
ncbi:MAG TPA: hypothetical protein VFJ16_18895 [Longimicrobium sp.]|nr:hypothetical protein [Longimicrobium sp.]